MSLRVGMNVENIVGEVAVAGNFLSFKRMDKEASSSLIHLVKGLGIGVEKMTELAN